MRLLIHHHTRVYRDGDMLYVQSFIGEWVKALEPHFEKIGLILHEVYERKPVHDSEVQLGDKIELISLGESLGRSDRKSRIQRIKDVCGKLTGYDALLVRGMTPRQKTVWDSVNVPIKSFLLVGSLVDSKPSLKKVLRSPYGLLMYYIRRSELRSMSKSGTIITNSPAVQHEVERIIGCSSSFIPTNSLSEVMLRPFELRALKQGKVSLLFCGRVVKEKGIEELIMSLRGVVLKGIQVELNIVGSITTGYKRDLELIIEKEGQTGRVHFKGYVPFGEELLTFYRESDLYVLPSYHEGFPHSIWEAAACSTPVISTKVGGIPSLVSRDEVELIEPRGSNQITAAILHLLTDSERRSHIAKNAYEKVIQYTVESCALSLKKRLDLIDFRKRV